MKQYTVTSINNTNKNRKEEKTMKDTIITNKEKIRKYTEAYERIDDFIAANEPIFDEDTFPNHYISPVMFEDEINALLSEKTRFAVIDIIVGADTCTGSRFILRFNNDREAQHENMLAIYSALNCGKKVLINGEDITTIEFEY